MSRPPLTRFYSATLLAYAILTTGLVFFLSYRLFQMGSDLAQVRAELNPSEGRNVPPFLAMDVNRKSVAVTFDTAPLTVLCFLSSDCEFCHKAAQLWNQLDGAKTLRIIGVAVDGVKAFSARNDWQLSFPLVEIADPAKRSALGISRVPLTLAVNRSGKVVFSFTGVPDEAMLVRLRSLAD